MNYLSVRVGIYKTTFKYSKMSILVQIKFITEDSKQLYYKY